MLCAHRKDLELTDRDRVVIAWFDEWLLWDVSGTRLPEDEPPYPPGVVPVDIRRCEHCG